MTHSPSAFAALSKPGLFPVKGVPVQRTLSSDYGLVALARTIKTTRCVNCRKLETLIEIVVDDSPELVLEHNQLLSNLELFLVVWTS